MMNGKAMFTSYTAIYQSGGGQKDTLLASVELFNPTDSVGIFDDNDRT